MTIEELIRQHAKDNRYDGLYNPEGECACSLDDGTFKECTCHDCEFGHIVECTNCKEDKCKLRDLEDVDMCVKSGPKEEE